MQFRDVIPFRSARVLLVGSAAAFGAMAPAVAGNLDAPAAEPVLIAAVPIAPTYDWGGAYVGGQLGYGWADASPNVEEGDSWLGGFHGGYRWDFGSWVAGTELEYNWSDIGLEGTTDDTTISSFFNVKLSAGIEAGPALVYATGGWSQAEADGNFDAIIAGLGVAYPISERWTASGEWLYYNFDDVNLGDISNAWANTISVRVSYRF